MSSQIKQPNYCAECGGVGISHRTKYLSVAVDTFLTPFFTPGAFTRPIFLKVDTLVTEALPDIFYFCVRIGIAKKQMEIDEHTQLLAQMLWKEARTRGINVWEFRLFNLPRNVFIAELPGGKNIFYEGTPLPPHSVDQARWIDDKAEMKKHFIELGIPVAKGGSASTKNKAKEIFEKLDAPIIVKPRNGSASRHTTIHIHNVDELMRAFKVATQVAPAAIIEEELVGPVYRATVVDGKLAATLHRDQPHVLGDGVSTIEHLVNEANKHPARSGPYFSKIKIDDSAMNELKWHGHTPKDVLPKGKRVTFHQKVNWSVGGTTTDVTDEVHPDNVALFERVAEVLKAPIVGIDFIISNISHSWKEQERCGIIECNSMPFFDNHHLPFEGKPRNVAGAIWDMMEK